MLNRVLQVCVTLSMTVAITVLLAQAQVIHWIHR